MKNRGEFKLVYIQRYPSRSEAMKREKQIKGYKGGQAFKKLLASWDRKKVEDIELAEVPPEAG
jgi:predicted GIY-YIG superfamily endonuclease